MLGGNSYLQQVTDCGSGSGQHFEPGEWINAPTTTGPTSTCRLQSRCLMSILPGALFPNGTRKACPGILRIAVVSAVRNVAVGDALAFEGWFWLNFPFCVEMQ